MNATPLITLETLHAISLFNALTTQQLQRIHTISRSRAVVAGTTILSVDRPTDILYIVVKGTMRIRTLLQDGSEPARAILGTGELIDMQLIDAAFYPLTTLEAVEDSTLLWFYQEEFHHCLQTMPTLSYNFARLMARRVHATEAYWHTAMRLDVPGRLAQRLLTLAQEHGQYDERGDTIIPMRLTQADLADLIGASRVRVQHAVSTFKRMGHVSVTPQYHIVIHDSDALTRLSR